MTNSLGGVQIKGGHYKQGSGGNRVFFKIDIIVKIDTMQFEGGRPQQHAEEYGFKGGVKSWVSLAYSWYKWLEI